MMFAITTGGLVYATALDEDTLLVEAKRPETLYTMIDSIALSGRALDDPHTSIVVTPQASRYSWSCEVSKATFTLFLEFEVLNYTDYADFAEVAPVEVLSEIAEGL